MIRDRVLLALQSADTTATANAVQHAVEVALREFLTFTLAAVSSLLLLDLPFAQLLFLSTVADLLTCPLHAQRFVGLRRVPERVLKDFGGRLLVNVAIIFVLVTLANALPRLFGYLIEVAVAAAAVRSGTGTLDHLLPVDHPFRKTWSGIVTRVESLWDVPPPPAEVPAGEQAPISSPPRPHGP